MAASCLMLGAAPCHAEWLDMCDRQAKLDAGQQSRLFQVAAIIKRELAQDGQAMALISRSGLDLRRFGIRYSHAGISLQASANAPWSVRQLYFACDERQPRLFDQGIAGFLLGTDNPHLGFISLVYLPEPEASALARAALDKREALRVLGSRYSANAYAFSTTYQNCNQWLIELMASAWGPTPGADADVNDSQASRARAQAWLKAQAYVPSEVDVGWRPILWAGAFVPLVHTDDHPREDLDRLRLHISMPASIEAFVHQRLPQAARVAFCHTDQYVLVHHGWDPMRADCTPVEGDGVIQLD